MLLIIQKAIINFLNSLWYSLLVWFIRQYLDFYQCANRLFSERKSCYSNGTSVWLVTAIPDPYYFPEFRDFKFPMKSRNFRISLNFLLLWAYSVISTFMSPYICTF